MFWYNRVNHSTAHGHEDMSLWDHLTRLLEYIRPSPRQFQFDAELIHSLQVLAERERRSEEEVAANLLSTALAQHNAAEVNLSCWEALSPREQQVVALTCLNYTNRQIAERLTLSPETVKSHLRNAQRKFGVGSKAELRLLLFGWDFSQWENMDF